MKIIETFLGNHYNILSIPSSFKVMVVFVRPCVCLCFLTFDSVGGLENYIKQVKVSVLRRRWQKSHSCA